MERGRRSMIELYTPRYLLRCAYMAMMTVHREAVFDHSPISPPVCASVAGTRGHSSRS